MAPSPFLSFSHWHEHKVLVIGQGDMKTIAKDLGFTDVYTIDQITKAYPLLDMVDHSNRKTIVSDSTIVVWFKIDIG